MSKIFVEPEFEIIQLSLTSIVATSSSSSPYDPDDDDFGGDAGGFLYN